MEVSKCYKKIHQPSEPPAMEVAVAMSTFESIQEVAVVKKVLRGIFDKIGEPVKGL